MQVEVEADVSCKLGGNRARILDDAGSAWIWSMVKVKVVGDSEFVIEELVTSMLLKGAGVVTVKERPVSSYSMRYPSLW